MSRNLPEPDAKSAFREALATLGINLPKDQERYVVNDLVDTLVLALTEVEDVVVLVDVHGKPVTSYDDDEVDT